jgi:hypothetical protein
VRAPEKGSGAWGSGRETRVMGASTTESAGGRLGKGVQQEGERESVRTSGRADSPVPPYSRRERGRESARARTRAVADRWGPPVRRRERARGLARLSWAE